MAPVPGLFTELTAKSRIPSQRGVKVRALHTLAAVRDVAEPSGLDIDALATRVAAVLAEDLYWFPVRHHSPAAAHFVATALQERRPRIVFIEGPAEANHLVPHLLHAKTKPPIAI